MDFLDNTNFERPEKISEAYAHYSLRTGIFSGTPSLDGLYAGVPLLYDRDHERLIVDGTDAHTLVFGSSGSKKTRAVVLPTIHMLCRKDESMIIHDAKGELYRRTGSMLKEQGYRVITINLRSPEVGHAWNPLAIPYRYYKEGDFDKAAEFANDVANTITLGDVAEAKDPFWEHSAHDCAFGLILLLFRYCKEMGLPDASVNIANLAALRRSLFEKGIRSKDSELWQWGSKDELIATSLSGTVMTAAETMQGILSTLDQKLRSFVINGALMDMLANSTFDIESIGSEKTAVFLITPDEKTSYHPLVAIFVSQSYQHLIYVAERSGGQVKRRINYILDEFSSLPAIGGDFPSMISAARSRNIRFLIVVQSKNQLVRRYKEEAATIMANCTNWIVMFTRELDLLREVSELCGTKSDGKPNISIFDLQHLSKERNEVLLMAGRLKPAVVNLIDIYGLDKGKYWVMDFETPSREDRCRIDFQEVEKELKKDRIGRMMNSGENNAATKVGELPSLFDYEKLWHDEKSSSYNEMISMADLRKGNSDKETLEAKLKERDSVVADILKRRNELLSSNADEQINQ